MGTHHILKDGTSYAIKHLQQQNGRNVVCVFERKLDARSVPDSDL